MEQKPFSISFDLLNLLCFTCSHYDVNYLTSIVRSIPLSDIESLIVNNAFSILPFKDREIFYRFYYRLSSLDKDKEMFFRKNGFFTGELSSPIFNKNVADFCDKFGWWVIGME